MLLPGLEPGLTANLAYRAYKARRATYTTGAEVGASGGIRTLKAFADRFSYHYSFHYQLPVCGLDYTFIIVLLP